MYTEHRPSRCAALPDSKKQNSLHIDLSVAWERRQQRKLPLPHPALSPLQAHQALSPLQAHQARSPLQSHLVRSPPQAHLARRPHLALVLPVHLVLFFPVARVDPAPGEAALETMGKNLSNIILANNYNHDRCLL